MNGLPTCLSCLCCCGHRFAAGLLIDELGMLVFVNCFPSLTPEVTVPCPVCGEIVFRGTLEYHYETT